MLSSSLNARILWLVWLVGLSFLSLLSFDQGHSAWIITKGWLLNTQKLVTECVSLVDWTQYLSSFMKFTENSIWSLEGKEKEKGYSRCSTYWGLAQSVYNLTNIHVAIVPKATLERLLRAGAGGRVCMSLSKYSYCTLTSLSCKWTWNTKLSFSNVLWTLPYRNKES